MRHVVISQALAICQALSYTRSLEVLEKWASEDANFTLPGFFCLQQAIVLVNGGRDGPLRIHNTDGELMNPDDTTPKLLKKGKKPREMKAEIRPHE